MKRWIRILEVLLCCLMLCGCGHKKEIAGQVTNYEEGTISITTDKGKTYDFVMPQPEVVLMTVIGFDQEDFAEDWDGCFAHVAYRREKGTLYAETVLVTHKLYRNVMRLSDGTPIDVWTDGIWREYRLEDGTVLLIEENPGGPENMSGWNERMYNDDFSEAAQQGIMDYYAEMGQRYDISALLEEAYRVYGFVEEYDTQMVSQFTGIEAYNEKIICCQMSLTIPQERANGCSCYFSEGTVFDRATGAVISNYDLFAIAPEELEEYLLDCLDADGDLDRENIQLNLKPEQIVLRQDGGIDFFLVDKVENGVGGMLQMGLSLEQAGDILQPWAMVVPVE